jgi:hypothetical protein
LGREILASADEAILNRDRVQDGLFDSRTLNRCSCPVFDEIVRDSDPDFVDSGLKVSSVIRIGRLAAVEGGMLLGSIGHISHQRLQHIIKRLTEWLTQSLANVTTSVET